MTDHSTGNAVAQDADIRRTAAGRETPGRGIPRIKDPTPAKQETTDWQECLQHDTVEG